MRESLTAFQQALIDSVLKEYADILDEQEAPAEFSERFDDWFAGFQKKPGSRAMTVLKGILIAAIIAALLAGAAMAIPAVRKAVIDFFFHKDDVRIAITFDPEQAATAPKEIKKPYIITYIPDVYMPIVEVNEIDVVCLIWTNSEGEMITFTQSPLPGNPEKENWWIIDGENVSHKTVLMGNYLVEILDSDGNYKLIWTNNEYMFMLELPYSINEEEMQKIFASWGPKE